VGAVKAQVAKAKVDSNRLQIYYKNIADIPFGRKAVTKYLTSLLPQALNNANAVYNKKTSLAGTASCLDSSFSRRYTADNFSAYSTYIMVAKNGDILLSGAANNNNSNSNNYLAYIIRLDKDGSVKWMKEYYNDKIGTFDFYRLYETSNNEIVAVGSLINNGDYTVDSNYSTSVVKLTENGEIMWATSFNSSLEKGKGECSGQSSVTVNSINPGLNDDIIFSGTTTGCPSPEYNTVFLLDKNGNIKWDANFACSVGFQHGISAVLCNGNILSVAKLDNIFSGGDYTIDLFFQILDYKTGKTISVKPFKADYAYPDFYYKSFGYWANQMQQGDDGHLYIYGNMINAYSPDSVHNEMFGVVEFDNNLSYVNGYTIGTNSISTDGQSGYDLSNIKVAPSGDAAINWVKFTAPDEQQIFFANIEKGRFVKSRMVYQHTGSYGNAELLLNEDNSMLHYSNYQTVNNNLYQSFLVLRKKYPSDTTQSACAGFDTSFAFLKDLKYIEYPEFQVNDSAFNELYTITNNFLVAEENINEERMCNTQSICDSIKIHGKLSYCATDPEAVFTAYKNEECGAAITWSFDSSSMSRIVYPNDTTLDVKFNNDWSGKIYAQTSGGACALNITDSVLVNVQSTKNVLNLGADTILCNGDSIVFNPGKYNMYTWQNGSHDSLFIAHQPGKYYIEVTDFCNNIYSDTLVVASAVIPSFTIGNDTSVCIGDTIQLNASNGFEKYNWFPSAAVNGNTQSASAIIQQNELIYANAVTKDGCLIADSININAKSARPVYLGNDTSFCDYASLILDAGAGYTTYEWNDGSKAQTLTINKAGNYIVVAKDANGCFASDSLRVLNVYAHPMPDLGNDKNICSGSAITLDAGKFFSYAWNDGSSAQHLNVSQPGTYWVKVMDNNRCLGSDTFVVHQLLQPPADFLEPVDSLCSYDELTLTPSESFVNYNWSTGEVQPAIIVDKPGLYTLTVTDANGCSGTDATDVVHKDCMNGVYIPSAFTPNNDGRNDVFRAMVFGRVVYFRLNVYDRFGELIFSTTDPSKGWNGLINGQPQNIGTYVWQCAYQLQGSDAVYKKGTLVLMH
jgi:gliding motility-associated-like protein